MANDLVTPEELEDFEGAPFPEMVVDAAVGALQAHTGWHIAPSVTETLTLDCDGGSRVLLPSLYVTAITAVRDTSGDDPVEITDHKWSRSGVLTRNCYWFPSGFQSLEVDLTHGYDQCPAELLQSIAAACHAGSLALTASRTIGPFSESYRDVSGSVYALDAAAARYTLPPRL